MTTIYNSKVKNKEELVHFLNSHGYSKGVPKLSQLYDSVVNNGGCSHFDVRATAGGTKIIFLMQNTEGVVLGYNVNASHLENLL